MIGCEVVTEEFIVNRGTHQNDSHFRVQTDHSFYGEQNEISIDVPLMHLIQQNEGVLLEELSAVYESLQEDAVSDENNPILGVDVGLHADLVANHA